MKKVLVTTKHRGVFFGESDGEIGETMTLKSARLILYWSQATRGFLGLAATGPAPGSRVSAAVPTLTIVGVTSVAECSEEAAAAIEAGPWS